MIYLRQSTASQEILLGRFLDSTDGNTEETGLTIANTDIKIWKTGATTLANKNSGGATHISNGLYYAVLDATDTDTIGPMKTEVHVTGALSVTVHCVVLDEAVYDVLFGTTAPSTLAAGALMGLADDAITSAKISAGAIGSSEAPLLGDINTDVETIVGRVLGTIAAGTHTAQSGDAYARIGVPAGASVSADLLAIDNFVDDLEGRLTATRAGYLDNLTNLDATISSRLATAGYTVPPTVSAIADQVWDETLSGHSGVGSTGAALSAAGGSGDPWATALPGSYGAGTAGALLGTTIPNAIADVPTVAEFNARSLPSADYTIVSDLPIAPDNASISAILLDTTAIDARLPSDPADESSIQAAIATRSATGDAMTLTSVAVDAILDDAVEGTTTLRQAIRLIMSTLFGKVSGAPTGPIVFRDIGDTKARVTATVDADGNRLSITRDAT